MRTSVSSMRWSPRWVLALAVALVLPRAAWGQTPTPPSIQLSRPANQYRVHTIDVDQGQAILVQTLQGKNILIDAGEDYAAPKLLGYLKKVGVKKIDWLVISHRHMDHIAGVGPLARAMPVENVVTPWDASAVPTPALAWLAPLRKDLNKPFGKTNRPSFHTATTGKVFDFGGGARGEVVWPPKATGKIKIGDHNEESVVMRVVQDSPGDKKGASFVVGGDLGWQLEKHIAQKYPHLLRADGLVGNHHGSGGSFERTYLEAVSGRSSPLLKALDNNNNSREGKLAQRVIQLAQRTHGKDVASRVGLQLYRESTNGASPKDGKLIKAVAQALQQQVQQGALPWMTYSAGNDNPYHHPNSQRMALATLLGTTMLGTDVHGSVVMTRSVGNDGKWQGPRWEGHTMGTLGLPDVADAMPEYKKKKDPKNPYDGAARTANYIFSLQRPDPTASWDDKEQYLPAKGQTENDKFLEIVRDARRGKTRFIRQLVADLRSSDPKVKAKAETFAKKWTKWHWSGAQLGALPWDQGQSTIFTANGTAEQNARFGRSYVQRLARRFALKGFARRNAFTSRPGGLASFAKPLRFAKRNSVLGGRTPLPRSIAGGSVFGARIIAPVLKRQGARRWQAQRNSTLGGRRVPLPRRASFLRPAAR